MSMNKDLSKIRSDSIWNSLPAERREIFEGWLFEERVSYATARERARTEWGVEASLATVGKYYRRVAQRRAVTDLEEMAAATTEVDGAEGKLEGLKASAMKLLGMQLLEKAIMRDDVREIAVIGRVLTQTEDREIQRDRLVLAREKFEYKATKAALKTAPLLNKIARNKQAREDAEVDEARLAIFGKPPPGYEDPALLELGAVPGADSDSSAKLR
jgi:hypothetical protein